MIDWFCLYQLKDYFGIFRSNPEVAGLMDISRRFSWVKRLLKNFDEHHANLFPEHWRMAENLMERFCIETRNDLSQVLLKDENEKNFDTKIMLAAFQLTREFEMKVNGRFYPMVNLYLT